MMKISIQKTAASQRVDQLLRLEHMVARCIASADSVSTALITVIRSICETQDWECGRYLRVDEQAGVLRFSECWNAPGDAIEQFIASKREAVFGPGAGLAGRAWQSGQPAWIADIKNDARSLKAAVTLQTGMHCAFHFPVMSEGKTIGVLAFNSRKVREPDDRLLQAVRVIGSQLGQFLQRKQAEEDLRQFRLALDNSADMILLMDRKTMRYVDVNQTACKLLGYSREELLKMGPGELLPESLDELARAHDELIADPSSLSRMRSHFRCRDGSTIPFESTRHVLRSGDNLIIAAICRDIREQLAAEEAQRQQVALIARSADKDRLLRLFYDLPFVGLAITSPRSKRWLQVNDYMCGMLGYPREELLELAWTEITHPDDLPANLALFQRLTAGEFDTFQLDKRFLRKDGAIVDTTTEVRCMRRPDGSVETVIIMVRDITEQKRAQREMQKLQEQLRDQAVHDPLTGLYNRRYLDETMGRELIRATRYGRPVGIVMCDIDHFKVINDVHGHLVGDEVLRVFAELLGKNARGSDIVCRYGGEEFLLFFPDMPPVIAYQRAEQLRTAFAEKRITSGAVVVQVTASFGVAAFPENGKTNDELIRAADEAMYEAKKAGRDRVIVSKK
jgi:diguanylate cyclase (GGDEF)-like protein/PAS domain S-box-containing protein